MGSILETGHELYAEMQRRGIHIRKEYGRDNSLLKELRDKLGCPHDRLAVFLKENQTTSSQFLKAFLSVAAPFAKMFGDIWNFLATYAVPQATESIRVRFGWDTEAIDLDIDQFRVASQMAQKIIIQNHQHIWPGDAVRDVFKLRHIINPGWQEPLRKWPQYEYMKPYTLLPFEASRHDRFEEILKRIHSLFQSMADADAAWQDQQKIRQRNLSELVPTDADEDVLQERPANSGLISDLLPSWRWILDAHTQIPSSVRNQAVEFFDSVIDPKLENQSITTEAYVHELLDILDLPFWRHRWHTYEIWATILVFKSLEVLHPQLMIDNKHLRIDVSSKSTIATLVTRDYPVACIVTQMETSFREGKRRAIRPDVSICYDEHERPESRALVIELKQRQALSTKHVEEVAHAYRNGSPQARGVFVINYDETGISPELPDNVILLEGVRPDTPHQMENAKNLILQWTKEAGLLPRYQRIAVLLDVSGSMRGQYGLPAVQKALRKLISLKGVKVYRFNDGLLPGGDLEPSEASSFRTFGGTSLQTALSQLMEKESTPEVVLVISDGEYEKRVEQLISVPYRKRLMPSQLDKGLDWLLNPEGLDFALLGSDPAYGTGV